MRIFAYLVARDWGFAPNPFYGYCTLACCKPTIRRVAGVGDLIVGCGTAGNNLRGHLVFMMRVTEKLDFAGYWADPRFERKRPKLNTSKLAFYGDNIYEPSGENYAQRFSHHSFPDGSQNEHNLNKDTSADHVLVSDDYVYFGSNAPKIPAYLRDFEGVDLCPPTQGHISKKIFPEMAEAVLAYFENLKGQKVRGTPMNW